MEANLFQLVSAGSAASASALAFFAFRRSLRGQEVDLSDPEAVQGSSLWRRVLSPIAIHMRPTNPAELEQLTTALVSSGRRSRDVVDRFLEEKLATTIGGMVLALVWATTIGGLFGAMLALMSLVLGLLGPMKLLRLRAAERRDAIATGFPSAVDLLTTCIEAGLSLEYAIARVAREIELSSPILADEFHITAAELQAGVSLPSALRRLSRRVGLDELSALCAVMAKAHGLGAPIGRTLRECATSSRRQRMALLEERAGKLSAQLTLPLATCLLPAAMLIILGPAIIQLVRALH